jgi:seryl-tRNA synthetase
VRVQGVAAKQFASPTSFFRRDSSSFDIHHFQYWPFVIRHSYCAMLDIRLIREKPDFVRTRLATRGGGDEANVDELLRVDAERRKTETELQQLQSERNRLSKEIGAKRSRKQPSEELEAQVRQIGEQIADLTQRATAFDEAQRNLLLETPNLPHESVPIGKDPSANRVVRSWGEKPPLTKPVDHVALGTKLNLFDLDRAAKLSGSGFICFTGTGAKLERGLINFMIDLHTRQHGYVEISPPFLVRRDCMIGTSQLPKFEADMYGLEENQLFLAPTAEVQLTNLHREEILSIADLPKKFVAYTPCFRREAGAAGRETRGIIRVHQFDKVELVKITAPEKSYEELESLAADAERVLQQLGLHYRVVELCTGDLGFGSAKTYDIEVWSPGQDAFLEVSSCSNFEGFQARRMQLRFKDRDGKNRFCHTLNASGLALPRLFAALIENYQQPHGSVIVPEKLQSYFGATEIR